jgi:hypothetical protein
MSDSPEWLDEGIVVFAVRVGANPEAAKRMDQAVEILRNAGIDCCVAASRYPGEAQTYDTSLRVTANRFRMDVGDFELLVRPSSTCTQSARSTKACSMPNLRRTGASTSTS